MASASLVDDLDQGGALVVAPDQSGAWAEIRFGVLSSDGDAGIISWASVSGMVVAIGLIDAIVV